MSDDFEEKLGYIIGDLESQRAKDARDYEELFAEHEKLIFLCTSNSRSEGERIYSELEELVK